MVNRLLCCLTILFPAIAFSQSSYRFRNFSIADGLSQSSVTCVVQDNVGTLWIGTQDGLNRFDGKSFEIFTSDDTPGLQSEYIHSSLNDKHATLWFGTANGLTSYNQVTEQFFTYDLPRGTSSIETLEEDAAGNIWMATGTQGLQVWNRKSRKIEPVFTGIPSKKLHYIKFLSDAMLLIGTEEKGAFVYNTATRKLNPINLGKSATGTAVIVNDAEHVSGTSFILSTNSGLRLFDYQKNSAKPFLVDLEYELGIIEIADVLVRSSSEIYIGTQSKGLVTARWENGKYRLTVNRKDILQKNALQFDEIECLFEDENNAIWLGTRRGLSCFNPQAQNFSGIGQSEDVHYGLPSASVWGFDENKDASKIFVATDVDVSVYDRNSGRFDAHYKLSTANRETSVLSLLFRNEHEILVGVSDGIYLLKINGPTGTYHKIPLEGIPNPGEFDRIYRIVEYLPSKYALASKGGVLTYDFATGKFTPYANDPKKPAQSISSGLCRVVYKGMDGKLYAATSNGGLYVSDIFPDGKLKFRPFLHNQALLNVTGDYITSIYQPNAEELWVGTTGSGILHIYLKTGKIEKFDRQRGAPNNFVYGVLPDRIGNLWLSTNKGLSRFSIIHHVFSNYSEKNGLMSDEFNTGAYFASKSGVLFFGGIAGFNEFNPRKLYNLLKPLQVRFEKFKLDDQWLHPGDEGAPFKASLSEVGQIALSYKERSFSIRFVASDVMNADLLEYKYRLTGDDEEEIFLGSTNEIRFNALSPGNYNLEIFVRRQGEEWSPYIASMEISVAAPFWQHWWFLVGMLLLAALVIWRIIRTRIEAGRREQVRLEMKIAERTREIREQNTKIEQQNVIIQQEKEKVERQSRLLQIEKDKSESLLRNIIPEATAEELKTKGRASARAYKTVSVLFTDFVGFTKIAEKMKPTELVNRLDVYFRRFDEIIVRNNLEKIKTIGDAYMCAGGVPVRNNTNPIDAVLAALHIQDYMSKLKMEALANNTEYWDLRLGINTGEVTAGVIGSERLAYDIWGSTVNQAQRMEMMGEPGRVTISGTTFKLVEPYFECTFRGKVQSKSKGMIDMFTVERIKPELSVNGEGLIPNERFQQIVNLHLYSSINYYKAERHIMKVLEKGLSPALHYHSIAHTKDVVRAVERYALLEGVTDEGLFLLKSAATYHDAGFVESYERNEPIGARMAEEILPKYGYSEQHIAHIKELIYVTQIPHQPKNKLEEIICDADLDYLGRDDFHEIADKLRLELREHGKIDSDRKWDEMQVSFLKMHRYFTETAIGSRLEKKKQNLQEVLDRLARNEYKD